MNNPFNILLNLLYMIVRFGQWVAGDISPYVSTLKITRKCNLKCKHCQWFKNPTKDRNTAFWKRTIYNIKRKGVRTIILEGGEPTLRKDLQSIIRFSCKLGLRTIVASNGMTPLSQYTPDMFYISIDGMQEEHNRIRGDGCFKIMEQNLKTAKVPIVALVSLSKSNVNTVEELLEYFKDKVSGFWFSFVYDYFKEDQLSLSSEERKKAGINLLKLSEKYNIINLPSYLLKVGTSRICKYYMLLTVNDNGHYSKGCMVDEIASCRCDDCDLACHRELSDFLDYKSHYVNLKYYLKRILQRR